MRILSYVFMFFVISCASNDNSNVIDLEDAFDNNSTIMLSELVNDIKYIQLETNNKSRVGNIEVKVAGGGLLVNALGGQSGMFLFNQNGEFIRKIGNVGKGPGEYRNIVGYHYENTSGEIIIKTDIHKRLLHFTRDGECYLGIDASKASGFNCFQSHYFLHIPPFNVRSDNKQLYCYSSKGEVQGSYYSLNVGKREYWDMFIEEACFSNLGNTMYYYVPRDNVVYKYYENKIDTMIDLKLGRYAFPANFKWNYEGYNAAKKLNKIRIEKVFVTKRYIFILVWKGSRRNVCLYDRQRKKTYRQVIDDIDGLKFDYFGEIVDNTIITPIYFEDSNVSGTYSKALSKIIEQRKVEDNPILRKIIFN